MSRRWRALPVAAAALVTLTLASAAPAAPNTATISVTHTPMSLSDSNSTTIHVAIAQTTDAIAAINIFVPAGYTANLQQGFGTTIGQVDATAIAHDNGLTLPLSGPVTTDDPSKHTTDACSPGTNAAVWNLNLSVAGQTLVVPLYVNPTSGASAALGSYNLKICLPPWDVPQGTPGRAFQGAQVLDAKFSVDKIFTTPASAGVARWEALFTPYTPGKGTPNPAGTFEARALVPLPAGVSLSARVVSHKKGTYRLTGKVSEGGAGSAGTAVTIARGTKPTALKQFGAVTTSSAGTFTLSGKAKRKKNTYFQASASAKERDVTSTGCASPLTAVAPAGCVSATLSPWSAKSAVVRVRP